MPRAGAADGTAGVGALPTELAAAVVGREAELLLLLDAVRLRRPVLILGPPGVSKTTMLRALARHLAGGPDAFGWVTADEQLTAHALMGTFDPSLVLRGGYRPEHFTAGPLVRAMRAGGVLYIEEINRAPSGALNALLTALSEGYVEIPRLGTVRAEPGFLVVAAANPHDDAGTTRLSRGLLDRFLVLEVGYQSRAEEIEIVRRHTAVAGRLADFAVDLARATRDHPELRQGASVRAAIDLVSVLAGRPGMRQVRPMLRAAVCATMIGRVRLRPTATRSACDLVMELFDGLLAAEYGGDLDGLLVPAADGVPVAAANDADAPGPVLSEAGDSPVGAGGETPEHPARRDELPGLERPGGSGEEGTSRSVPMVSRERPLPPASRTDGAAAPLGRPLADFERVVRAAAELVLRVRGEAAEWLHGGDGRALRSQPWRGDGAAELDLAATLDNVARTAGRLERDDVHVLTRAPERADYLILVDHSGSMAGDKLELAAVLAGVLADLSAAGRIRYGVVAFDERLTTLKPLAEEHDVEQVIERILRLPEGKATDLSAALRAAVELTDDLPEASETILISDCMPTKGTTTFAGLAALARRLPSLHICFVEERQPAIQLFSAGPQLNLYEWWARRWVGDERVHSIRDIDEADRLTDALSRDDARI